MAWRSWQCLVVFILLSGCVSDDGGDDIVDDPAAAAPAWSVGDWWTYRWDSDIYGFSFDATVIAGNVTTDGYGVGMDLDDYELNALLFHLPALGPLDRNLSYEVHEVLFEPLLFPLTEGKTWETTYIAAPVNLTARAVNVTAPDGPVPGFRITNDGHAEASGRHYNMEYAPSVGWFTLFERVELDGTLRERITLLDHGHGHNGTVRVPGDIQVLYLNARTTGLLDSLGSPAAPVDTFEPPAGLDRVFVACLYGDAPGTYHASVTGPSGTGCGNTGTIAPTEPPYRRIAQRELPYEAGTWEVVLTAGGQGLAIAEVLGYPAADVTLG